MNRKILFYLSIFVVFAITIFFVIKHKTDSMPVGEIDKARKIMAEAELINSSNYAKDSYALARLYYDSAMYLWASENERFIILRNYDIIREYADRSTNFAELSISQSKRNITNIANDLERRKTALNRKIEEFEGIFGKFPMDKDDRDKLIKCKMEFKEGALALESDNYANCEVKFDSAEPAITSLLESYGAKMADYFEDYPRWTDLVNQSINNSRRNKTYCVIVDKMARECYLYNGGRLVNTFTVELGANWVGNKTRQGDKSTPEGVYNITEKKSNGRSKYYKALLLDYPNEEDKLRFTQNKRNGLISSSSKIGSHIEIHGDGGKGADWTDGCVALENSEMDILYRLCSVGSTVTIVGSTRPLNELLAAN